MIRADGNGYLGRGEMVSPVFEGFHDCQHLSIPIFVVELGLVQFLGPVLHWVEQIVGLVRLEEGPPNGKG